MGLSAPWLGLSAPYNATYSLLLLPVIGAYLHYACGLLRPSDHLPTGTCTCQAGFPSLSLVSPYVSGFSSRPPAPVPCWCPHAEDSPWGTVHTLQSR